MILTLRTDSPVAEVGLYEANGKKISYHTWPADRQLSTQLLSVIYEQLQKAGIDWSGLTGIAVYEGPGSFTGLRIGITVANALAYSLQKPVVAARGEDWLSDCMRQIQSGHNAKLVLPHYGAEANITLPKK